MYLDARAVQRDGLDLDAHNLSTLQLLEHPIEHAGLGPPIHACIDRVPIAEPLGQTAPLAAVLGHIQHRVQHTQVRQADVASLCRQTMCNLLELGLRDLHTRSFRYEPGVTPVVLTRPRGLHYFIYDTVRLGVSKANAIPTIARTRPATSIIGRLRKLRILSTSCEIAYPYFFEDRLAHIQDQYALDQGNP